MNVWTFCILPISHHSKKCRIYFKEMNNSYFIYFLILFFFRLMSYSKEIVHTGRSLRRGRILVCTTYFKNIFKNDNMYLILAPSYYMVINFNPCRRFCFPKARIIPLIFLMEYYVLSSAELYSQRLTNLKKLSTVVDGLMFIWSVQYYYLLVLDL